MKRCSGTHKINDDEWYTPYETALKVAQWLSNHVSFDTPILCPCDLLPDGKESEIPCALRNTGFKNVRVTRDLPMIGSVHGKSYFANNYNRGEIIVTNPPFSLLVPFRKFTDATGVKFVILSRLNVFIGCNNIFDDYKFYDKRGKGVVAAWFCNFVNTAKRNDMGLKHIGNCRYCMAKKCPSVNSAGNFRPGLNRKLYNIQEASKLHILGNVCSKYTIRGKTAFWRFYEDA